MVAKLILRGASITIFLLPPSNVCYLHFTGKATEALRGWVTAGQSQYVGERWLRPGDGHWAEPPEAGAGGGPVEASSLGADRGRGYLLNQQSSDTRHQTVQTQWGRDLLTPEDQATSRKSSKAKPLVFFRFVKLEYSWFKYGVKFKVYGKVIWLYVCMCVYT